MALPTHPPFPATADPSAEASATDFSTTAPPAGSTSSGFPDTFASTGSSPSDLASAPSSPSGFPSAAAPAGGATGPVPAGRRRTGGHSPSCAPPDHDAPQLQGVPPFEPLKVRGSALRLQRALRRQRRAMAAGLAVTAAALAASTAHGADDGGAEARGPGAPAPTAAAPASAPASARKPQAGEQLVSAAVRIADAATVRLLRPGDRVDVIAAAESVAGDEPPAEIVASCVRVTEVPETGDGSPEAGALVVLSVPRTTATALAGAGATSRLAVTVC
ncbi:hypothetical protein ACFQ60_22145 [Streptomyces zhihengii]|uniref:hypothetical protein n=1 Tax=Streptomyces zhihengii TaxID=1818004 RepID=UPI0027DCA0E2|nr:hypothetical protein [Streptomyces zhihengii]